MTIEREDTAVGYRKPPERTQFESGRSGNPKGRPRGAKNLTTLLAETLSEGVVVTENGRRRKITKLAAACKQLVNKALAGDLRGHAPAPGSGPADRWPRTQASPTDEATLTDQVDQEIMRQLRDRVRRAARAESEGDAKGGDSDERSDRD
jgi:hypothetical protein